MARTPFRENQQVAATTLTSLYTVGTGLNATISVVSFTNTTSTAHNIDIYHYDTADSTDYLKHSLHLPAGSGRERQYFGFERAVFETGDIIKVQSDSATAFNTFIYGSEVEI